MLLEYQLCRGTDVFVLFIIMPLMLREVPGMEWAPDKCSPAGDCPHKTWYLLNEW